MDANVLIIMGVGKRDPNSWTEQYLRQMYTELPFDMHLVAENDKKIPVHSFVLMMFSPHLRNKFKTDVVFDRAMDVSFKEYSYEVLCDMVKMLYFGRVAIRVEILSQLNKILQHLEIACPCCLPIECQNNPVGEESDGEGWQESCSDPIAALMHGNEKMYHGCITPGCLGEIATKVVDGKIMIKKTKPNHSSECIKIHDEKYGQLNSIDSESRKRTKSKRSSAKKKDSDSEGSSSDVPKKQMKNTEGKPTAGSVKKIESKSTDTKMPETSGSTAEDKETVANNHWCTFETSDDSGTSDSSLDSGDSSSDDDSTSSTDN